MSSTTIDYYFATMSPWTYLGHERFAAIARAAGARINLCPIDLGKVFPVSGGLPLAKRAPQRQAYRLVELRRFADHLKLPLNLHPAHFPVAGRRVRAPDPRGRPARRHRRGDGADRRGAARGLGRRAQHRRRGRPGRAAEGARPAGAPARRCREPPRSTSATRRTRSARSSSSVFGAPSYVIDGELFWGQDRLDFVERRLAAPPA